jgi:aspartate kinase
MFKTLSDEGINLEMITTSEIKISVLVDRSRCEDALLAVHRGFQLEQASAPAPAIGASQSPARRGGGLDNADLLQAVVSRLGSMEDIVVSEVLLDDAQSLVTVSNIPDVPGSCTKLFTAVANGHVMVDMIVQNVSHSGQAAVSFTIPRSELEKCLKLMKEFLPAWPGAALSHEAQIAKLSVSGIGLRTHTGVGEKMFKALAEAGINIQMINTSEIRMSAVVAAGQGAKGHAALKGAFGLE